MRVGPEERLLKEKVAMGQLWTDCQGDWTDGERRVERKGEEGERMGRGEWRERGGEWRERERRVERKGERESGEKGRGEWIERERESGERERGEWIEMERRVGRKGEEGERMGEESGEKEGERVERKGRGEWMERERRNVDRCRDSTSLVIKKICHFIIFG